MATTAIERRHRFTVEEWQRMGDLGLFPPDYRGELIEGEIVDRAPIGTTHSGCVMWLNRFFAQRIDDDAIVSPQNPLRLGDISQPEPDIVLLRPRDDFYRTRHPTPGDTLLAIEVADSSVRYDREVKAPLYALYRITEYWLVDLPAQIVEVLRGPRPGGYQEHLILRRGDTLSPQALSQIELRIDEVLG